MSAVRFILSTLLCLALPTSFDLTPQKMLVTSRLLQVFLPLGFVLFTVDAIASPVALLTGRAKRTAIDALPARREVIFQQVGGNGMQELYQAVLPHASAKEACGLFSSRAG